jgi:hypothetical protein
LGFNARASLAVRIKKKGRTQCCADYTWNFFSPSLMKWHEASSAFQNSIMIQKNSWVHACSYHMWIALLNRDSQVQAGSAESLILLSQLHKFYFSKAGTANRVKWTAQALIIRMSSALDTYVPICTKSKLGP